MEVEQVRIVKKLWGWEEILVNNDQYCGKLLHILPDIQASRHYHRVKRETFKVLSGVVLLELDGDRTNIHSWFNSRTPAITVPPGVVHTFRSIGTPAVVLEVSTHHDDEDVVRLAPSQILNA